MSRSIYDFKLKDIAGKEKSLKDFEGKVVLLVNVASKCGLTPQYEGLQKLYAKYKDQGFVVLGFPANNFMGQEPGTEKEIADFCSSKYDVTFPLFAKISVKGDDIHPFYKYLTTEAEHHGDIEWNFHKFLVDRTGHVVANISAKTKPEDVAPMIEKYVAAH
jgi:glutathione peroxidase